MIDFVLLGLESKGHWASLELVVGSDKTDVYLYIVVQS